MMQLRFHDRLVVGSRIVAMIFYDTDAGVIDALPLFLTDMRVVDCGRGEK